MLRVWGSGGLGWASGGGATGTRGLSARGRGGRVGSHKYASYPAGAPPSMDRFTACQASQALRCSSMAPPSLPGPARQAGPHGCSPRPQDAQRHMLSAPVCLATHPSLPSTVCVRSSVLMRDRSSSSPSPEKSTHSSSCAGKAQPTMRTTSSFCQIMGELMKAIRALQKGRGGRGRLWGCGSPLRSVDSLLNTGSGCTRNHDRGAQAGASGQRSNFMELHLHQQG